MVQPFNWTCPHCGVVQSVVSEKFRRGSLRVVGSSQQEGMLVLEVRGVGCSNPDCMKTFVHADLGPGHYSQATGIYSIEGGRDLYFSQAIYPNGSAKPQPDYIPIQITQDYCEACLIKDLSPKASATLIRRCLQGVIRDFTGISKSTLFREIEELKRQVEVGEADRSISEESVAALDHVRSIGNIGAHMEKDINVIIDVDPGEAQALIELAELLFEEWYGARAKRQQRLAKIEQIAARKSEAKKEGAESS